MKFVIFGIVSQREKYLTFVILGINKLILLNSRLFNINWE